MQYGSTYAQGTGAPYGGAAVSWEPLPAPKPAKSPLSTKIFTGGMAFLFVAMILSIAGVPGNLGYDNDAAGERSKPTSSNPLAVQNSMDSNLRWMSEQTNDEPGHYIGEIKSINQHELAIPAMAQGLQAMSASVVEIDSKLREVLASTNGVAEDMGSMVETSTASAAKMDSLGGDVANLGTAMAELGAATELLTERMGEIEGKAGSIAENGTSAALKSAAEMNAALPDNVPAPETERTGANVGNPVVAGAQR